MDTLTHALSGALLARALPPRHATMGLGAATTAGFFAAAFPDIDSLAMLVSPLFYLAHHRGATHSLLLLPAWAALLAWLFARLDSRRPPWRDYFIVCAAALAIHIAVDLITSFGTMILAPFSDRRFAWSTTFIIDLWFTGILVAGLAASFAWRRGTLPARLALAVLAGYVLLQAAAQHEAHGFGRTAARDAGIAGAKVDVVPRPVSPFNWLVVIDDGETLRYAQVNLRRSEPPPAPPADAGLIARLDAAYRPPAQAEWSTAWRFGNDAATREFARRAFERPELGFFRWFADLPLLDRVTTGAEGRCAWFRDLRFLVPGRERWPFRYGACERADGSWQAYEWDDATPVALRP